jgi:hypothetical protein
MVIPRDLLDACPGIRRVDYDSFEVSWWLLHGADGKYYALQSGRYWVCKDDTRLDEYIHDSTNSRLSEKFRGVWEDVSFREIFEQLPDEARDFFLFNLDLLE